MQRSFPTFIVDEKWRVENAHSNGHNPYEDFGCEHVILKNGFASIALNRVSSRFGFIFTTLITLTARGKMNYEAKINANAIRAFCVTT